MQFTIESISAWLVDWSVVTISSVLPPRDPNDDDDEEEEDEKDEDEEVPRPER